MKTLDDIHLNATDRAALREAAHVMRENFPVESVILYGSKAMGLADAESDLDLLVLTSRELTWKERGALTDAMFEVELNHDVVISTLVISAREWSEGRVSVLPIRDEVERYGVAA